MGMRVEGSRPGWAPGPRRRNKARLGPQAHVFTCASVHSPPEMASGSAPSHQLQMEMQELPLWPLLRVSASSGTSETPPYRAT